jgi:hypothetical protein
VQGNRAGRAICGFDFGCRLPIYAIEEAHGMSDRPRFFEDLAGVAGGAISALAGLRDEMEAMVRARTDETIRRLELVRREELAAVTELAAKARAGQEAAEARLAALEARLATLEQGLGGVAKTSE